jgi:hypothetical protein
MTEQVSAATGSTAQKKEPKIVQSRLDDEDYDDIDYEEEERLYIQKLEEEEERRPRYAPSFNEFKKQREQARKRREQAKK